MPLILNGTTGVSGVDGSAGTPSYQGNDSNTGVFFPAADTIAFAEGGAEVMRITSAGDVGIGTTNPVYKFQVNGLSASFGATDPAFINNVNGTQALYLHSTATFSEVNELRSVPLLFAIGGSERVRITSSGDLLVGTTASSAKLTVNGSVYAQNFGNGGTAFQLNDNTGTAVNQFIDVSLAKAGGAYNYMKFAFNNIDILSWGGPLSSYSDILTLNSPQSAIVFKSANTERMRITSAGDVYIGATAPAFGSRFVVSKGSGDVVGFTSTSGVAGDTVLTIKAGANGTDTTTVYTVFQRSDGVARGNITATGTNGVVYNTSSDYRLKNITGKITGYKERIMALQPKQGTWKEDGSEFKGFLAHEFAEQYPNAVSGEKDAVDAEGNPMYQGMQAGGSETIADLVAFVQEQQAMIEELKAEVAALKAK